MQSSYTPTQDDIDTAWPISSRRFGYPEAGEKIAIALELHPQLKSFVRMGAIPDRFHEAIRQLSRGSTCPYIDEKQDAMYEHDVYRWLRALGIEAEFKAA